MTAVRLAPVWAVVTLCVAALAMPVIGAGLATVSTGADRAVAIALGVVGLCGTVFVGYGFWPRKPQPLSAGSDGTVSIAAPTVQVAAVLIGWCWMWIAAGLFVFMIATRGLGEIGSPGAAVVIVGATLASTPDLVRLLTGRLHRWRLTWGSDGVTYRGYRTSVELPPGALKEVRIQAARLFRWTGVPETMRPRAGGPRGFGVVLDPRGSGRDVVVPQVLFREPAEQIAQELRVAAR